MIFSWFTKKAEKEIKSYSPAPRTWAVPMNKVEEILELRSQQDLSLLHKFKYLKSLYDAGFNGFGHGNWVFRYGKKGFKHFPCPYLEEVVDTTTEEQ